MGATQAEGIEFPELYEILRELKKAGKTGNTEDLMEMIGTEFRRQSEETKILEAALKRGLQSKGNWNKN